VAAAEAGGYGLLNVQSRLVLAFGAACGLTVESERGRGTVVTVVHPYMKELLQREVADDEPVERDRGG
jgi:sensor histidine kinase YesM